MITQRAGIYSGIGYTLALLVWAMTQLYTSAHVAATAASAIQAILVTQYLLVPVVTPWLARGSNFRSCALNIVMFTYIPLPLLLVLAKSSDAAGKGLWQSQLTAACLAAFSYMLAHALLTRLAQHRSRRVAIGTLQILTAALVWAGRDYWLPWLTS